MAPGRKIIHVDMDAFYTSVEQRDRAELRGKPLIVGGTADRRGVVASCSYEARKFGVRSAMSSRKALQLCPHAVIVPPDMARYKEASRKIQAIFLDATDLVEPLSLDEAYLDVTVNKMNEPLARVVAAHLRARILAEVGLTASAGVGPNKFIAKLASDMRKPNALVVIPPERVADVVAELPVEKLWGVGPATAKKLHTLGLKTARDIRAFPVARLEGVLGKFGAFVYRLAHGEDDRAVNPDREPKSRASETTFDRDTVDMGELVKTLRELAADLETSLKKRELAGHTVTLKVKYHDFRIITRSRTLSRPTAEASIVVEITEALLRESTEAGRVAIRLLGITVSNFPDPEGPKQLELV